MAVRLVTSSLSGLKLYVVISIPTELAQGEPILLMVRLPIPFIKIIIIGGIKQKKDRRGKKSDSPIYFLQVS
jgi:hypothetical protein